ncbi:hypothetical protein CY34DRAFT_110733 [Suillus luteus UH-Slu-Lm8-n1]|uniref:Uncharacterized protein n=1 Tax=Suillus luteus UH-Slu-Lm8-n1 TaxID=930992 RepID=A0A0D0AFZ0_9AGAM|nr:hypothetical protein CY34DRAFT_110733 [Suillus luteus UH-Slu-Lm8-n1]
MSSAVLGLIKLHNGEGAVIFIERQMHGKPVFHIKTSTVVKASGVSQSGKKVSSLVLIVINGLYHNLMMMANMIKSNANALTVDCVYAESLKLVNFLVSLAENYTAKHLAFALQWTVTIIIMVLTSNIILGFSASHITPGPWTEMSESQKVHNRNKNAHPLKWPPVFLSTPWMVQEAHSYLTLLRDVLAWQSCSSWT